MDIFFLYVFQDFDHIPFNLGNKFYHLLNLLTDHHDFSIHSWNFNSKIKQILFLCFLLSLSFLFLSALPALCLVFLHLPLGYTSPQSEAGLVLAAQDYHSGSFSLPHYSSFPFNFWSIRCLSFFQSRDDSINIIYRYYCYMFIVGRRQLYM